MHDVIDTSTGAEGALASHGQADELAEIIAIGRAIASERDIRKLLGLILQKTRGLCGADAGSVYIVEGLSQPIPRRTLRFMVSQNDSIKLDFTEFSLPLGERSIVGRAALTQSIINIADLYALDQPDKNPWGFRHDKTFDQRTGYEGHSMLTVPMKNQRDEVIGVIQLINKRRSRAERRALRTRQDFIDEVLAFSERDETLAMTLATQAGVSLENTLLYEDIRRLFEGFVQAAVTAIESRDPTTSGHSSRVAVLTTGLAEMVDKESSGLYADTSFTDEMMKQIEYAALLHDFGKVGVREQVLVKAKKLYEPERELILLRFDYIRRWRELGALQRRHDLLISGADVAALEEIDEELRASLQQIDEFIAFILRANEPTVLAEGSFEQLAEIAAQTYVDPRGNVLPYLTADEVTALRLPRGSLTNHERLEIESHVVHTATFLETIPWGRRFAAIPEIASGHHEKLDGTGYPHRLKADQIRIETRMMTIADIFDALTASDRPYKKAVPVERALDILHADVRAGKCDPELYRIFVETKLWRRVLG